MELIKEKLYGKEEEGELLVSFVVVYVIILFMFLRLTLHRFRTSYITSAVLEELMGWNQLF